ncbi:MAG: flagellar hook capping FlgD N-terminal domain-containing protein [Cyanobacteria bacterium P01_H01_bin.74]
MSTNVQNTLTNLINNTNQVNFENNRSNLGSSRLDRESFIQLILAQITNQDPTNPQDSTDMLSQQLQLEQVDQMSDVVNATKFSQASSLVGKTATLPKAPWDFENNVSGNLEIDFETNTPIMETGTIDSVRLDQERGIALIEINGEFYDMDAIQSLSGALPLTSTP